MDSEAGVTEELNHTPGTSALCNYIRGIVYSLLSLRNAGHAVDEIT